MARRKSRRSRKICRAACPIIRVRCSDKGGRKMCSVQAGGKARRLNSAAAGALVGKMVRAQKKRRCNPVVKRVGAGASTFKNPGAGI